MNTNTTDVTQKEISDLCHTPITTCVDFSNRKIENIFMQWYNRGDIFKNVRFINTDLSYSDFNRAYLKGATFDNCKLKDVTLSTSFHNKEDILNIGKNDDIPKIDNIFQKLYNECSIEDQFDMCSWVNHTPCGTTRCIAGWTIHLGGETGKTLKEKYGYDIAALLILYKNSKFDFSVNFYEKSTMKALEQLKYFLYMEKEIIKNV